MSRQLTLVVQLVLLVAMAISSSSGCGDGIDLSSDKVTNSSFTGIYETTTPFIADSTPPQFVGGTITLVQATDSTLSLSWPTATDNQSKPEDLQYELVYSYYFEDVNGDVNSQTLAVPAMAWGTNTLAKTLSGLENATTYYLNVLVRDQANNVTAIGSTSFATKATSLSFSTGQNAAYLLGQTDWAMHSIPSPMDLTNRLMLPLSATANATTFLVADAGANRVVTYPIPLTSPVPTATLAIGQPSLAAGTAGTDAAQMDAPNSVFVRGNRLFVADAGNSRALLWKSIPTSNGSTADLTIGGGNVCGESSMKTPGGIATDGRHLVVSDSGNQRVLVYNSIPTTYPAIPDLVLGQSSLTDCTSSATFSNPQGVWTNGTWLAVADPAKISINVWKTFPTATNQPADFTLSQNISVNTASWTGLLSLVAPTGIASNGIQFFVSDSLKNAVFVWDLLPTSNTDGPTKVLGQPAFGLAYTASFSQAGLDTPTGLSLSNGALWVADKNNHRVVGYLP